jgi:hypothetical protein
MYRKQFDDDVRDLVKVKIIHGFWKNTDERRIALLVCIFLQHSTIINTESIPGGGRALPKC